MKSLLQQKYGRNEASAIERLILEKRFGLTQTDMLLGRAETLSEEDKSLLKSYYERILHDEPVQYVLGEADFCGRTFKVSPSVLIPRAETAELVTILRETVGNLRVLDVCTGSGCIAVTLALEGAEVTATDISHDALSVARENALRHGVSVNFIQQDALQGGPSEMFDFIVSNPPYICRDEAAEMEANVLEYEPHVALFVPNSDPLLFYRAIAEYAASHLNPGGTLAFEINRRFGEETRALLQQLGFNEITVRNDQFDNPRFVFAKAPTPLCNR